MKNRLFILAAVAGMFTLASCSHGPSAETKAKVASFDSAWTAMGAVAKAAEDSIHACVAMCEGCCKAGDAMDCCAHTKGAKDSLMMPCKGDLAAFQEMEKGWDAQKPMWDSLMTQFTALKEKVAKGEGTDEEINAALAPLQAAMDKGNAGLQEGAAKVGEMKAACMKNMESCKSGWAGVACTEKKCDHAKKKS